MKGNVKIYPSQFYNKVWLQAKPGKLQAKPDRNGLCRSGSPHLTVAMEKRIKTLALLVFLRKIMRGECISPPLLKFHNQSSNTVLHVYSALYPFFQWDESTGCIQHGPAFCSAFTSHVGTLSLTHRDELETDVLKGEAI